MVNYTSYFHKKKHIHTSTFSPDNHKIQTLRKLWIVKWISNGGDNRICNRDMNYQSLKKIIYIYK